ncbi:MAG: 2-phosphosulfolactate phosphatase [Candidatus Kariarchaeaceae archaeon]
MLTSTILESHEDEKIAVRQFGKGALAAATKKGITVIIDVFRASNTALALLELNTVVFPVETVDEALVLDVDVTVGEQDGQRSEFFEFDNSPTQITENKEKFIEKRVVFRTTNGTRGLIRAKGSKKVIMGSIRNLSAVIRYCKKRYEKGNSISFVAMGSKGVSRIEDTHCAKMMYYKLLEECEIPYNESTSDNPWKRDWKQEIIDERVAGNYKTPDYHYSLELDATDAIPNFNQYTNRLYLRREPLPDNFEDVK